MEGRTLSPATYELAKRLAPTRKLGIVGEILLAYVHVRWLLWRHDLPTAVAVLRQTDAPPFASDDLRPQAIGYRLGGAVQRTLRLVPFDARCLVRSLVLTRMLARRGIESKVVIGVCVAPKFAAHAWVESRDIALLPALGHEETRLAEV